MIRKQMLLTGLVLLIIVLAMALPGCIRNKAPQPGAYFKGTIEIDDKVSSAEIGFDISEDGTSIKNLYLGSIIRPGF